LPFCPRCRSEYNVGVAECIDCHVPLVLHRPQRRPLLEIDTDELLVPFGALACLLMSLALFGITNMARSGQLAEPLASMIAAQPVCLSVFYAIGAIASGLIFAIALLRWLFFRS
jgi:hypothetical protein